MGFGDDLLGMAKKSGMLDEIGGKVKGEVLEKIRAAILDFLKSKFPNANLEPVEKLLMKFTEPEDLQSVQKEAVTASSIDDVIAMLRAK